MKWASYIGTLTFSIFMFFSFVPVTHGSGYDQPLTDDTFTQSASGINRLVIPMTNISGDIQELSFWTGVGTSYTFVLEWWECTYAFVPGSDWTTQISGCTLASQRGINQTAVSGPDKLTYTYSTSSPEFTFDPDLWYNLAIIDNETSGSIDIYGDNSSYSLWSTTTLTCVGTGNCSDLSFYPGFEVITSVAPPTDLCNTGYSRICDFNPQDGDYFTGPTVDFDVTAWVNENDLGTLTNVVITLRNIDQNVLLLGFLSPSDIVLLDESVETAGQFNYATTGVSIGDGNYRIRACLNKEVVYSDFIPNWIFSGTSWFIDDIDDCQSHQFIVGTSTFIGNLSQNLWDDYQEFLGNKTATSTALTASSCNPLLDFDVRDCFLYLMTPDPQSLNQTLNEAKQTILTRIPWGYLTRTVSILSNPATSTLPSFTATVQIGPGNDLTPETTSITIDPGDMIAGAGALVDSIEDPINGATFRDVFYPIISGTVALLVLLIIILDLTGMARGDSGPSEASRRSKENY